MAKAKTGRAKTKDKFREFMLEKGLKSTTQRELILDEFLGVGSHLSTEELYLRLRRKNPRSRSRVSMDPMTVSPLSSVTLI